MITGTTKNKIKILYIITQSKCGGAQRYVFDLAANLDKNAYDIVVAAGKDNNEFFEKLNKKRIKTIKLQYLLREINPLLDILGITEFYNIIKKEKPDVVHLNSTKAGILGSIAGKIYKLHNKAYVIPNLFRNLILKQVQDDKIIILKIPEIIYTAHGWIFNEDLPQWKKQLYVFLEKFVSRWRDKIICVSEYDKKMALKFKIVPEEKLSVIHNGIDPAAIKFLPREDARKELFLKTLLKKCHPRNKFGAGSELVSGSADKMIIGTIANLYHNKGIDILIRAAKIVIEKKPNAIFIVIGGGPERKKLENLIIALGLQKQFFLTGQIPNARIYLKALDIFVLPSRKEGFPYTILEALSANLLIIAANVGGVPEIIENQKNGILVPPLNHKILSETILSIINNKAIKEKFKINNIEKIKLFSLIKMISDTENIYKKRREMNP